LKGILRCCCNLGISSRFIADSASVAAPGGDRFGIRYSFSGTRIFPDGREDASRHQRRAGCRAHEERSGRADFPWMLLGVHATRMDACNRDINEDERLNLNCAWYANVPSHAD